MLDKTYLESLRWKREGPGIGDSFGLLAELRPGTVCGQLIEGAPKLALACLADRAFAVEVGLFFQDTNAPLGAKAWRRVQELDAALAAAGVEVP